jgi:hypothetical protein
MATRLLDAEPILAAPRRQNDGKRDGERRRRTALPAPPGRLDGTAADALTRAARVLMLTGRRSFTLDLRLSDDLDPRGASGLLSLRSEVAPRGGQVRLVVAAGSRAERMLRLLCFDALFPILSAANPQATRRMDEAAKKMGKRSIRMSRSTSRPRIPSSDDKSPR